jgi:tetratricopeptide (TPR) repeat protein
MKKLHLVYIFTISTFLFSCGTRVDHDLVITNVNIINVETGEILKNQTLGIDSNRISKIYSENVSASWGSEKLDGKNGYVIPGLWDMHAHYQSYDSYFSKLLLANGVTGIREMWGDMDSTSLYRNKNKQGYFGPDIYSAGAIIDGVPQMWPESAGVSNAEEAKAEVLKQIDQGVDFIKVYSGLSKEAFDAIAETANEHNISFAGHVPNSINIFHAIEKGMSSSEHGLGLITGSSSKGDSLLQAGNTPYMDPTPFITTFSEARFDSLCNLLAQSEMWLCPTFIVNQNYNLLDKPEELQKSPLLAYIKRDLKSKWFVYKDDSISTAKHKKGSELLLNLVSKAHAKGVKILAGSDFPNPYTIPGFSMHDELEILVSGGIDELSVLQMATSDAATFMNKKADFGTVAEGKVASLVLLSDNPLENIANTRTIEAVIQRGQLYDKNALEELLASVKEEVASEQMPYSKVFKNLNSELAIDAALDSLTTLIQSSNPDYFLDEIDLAYVMGDFLNEGKMDELVKFGEYMTVWFPESHRAYLWSGDAYMQAGYYEKARQQLNKSLEMNPDSERAKQYLEELEQLR